MRRHGPFTIRRTKIPVGSYTFRDLSLRASAREYVWLLDHRAGVSDRAIARREGITAGRVRFGRERAAYTDAAPIPPGALADLKRARGLIPLFPIGPYTPLSVCPHRGPIAAGSRLICMICHNRPADGPDLATALRNAGTGPPEPEPTTELPPIAEGGPSRPSPSYRTLYY